jgi:hypothetical protein
LGGLAIRALPLVVIVATPLAACSVSSLLPDWSSPDVAGPEPAYRYVIATHIRQVVGEPTDSGTFEISSVRRVDAIKGASWQACIRTQKFPLLPQYYAVFIQRDRIVDSRVSVLIDQCEMETYTPFDWIAEGSAPPPAVTPGGGRGE